MLAIVKRDTMSSIPFSNSTHSDPRTPYNIFDSPYNNTGDIPKINIPPPPPAPTVEYPNTSSLYSRIQGSVEFTFTYNVLPSYNYAIYYVVNGTSDPLEIFRIGTKVDIGTTTTNFEVARYSLNPLDYPTTKTYVDFNSFAANSPIAALNYSINWIIYDKTNNIYTDTSVNNTMNASLGYKYGIRAELYDFDIYTNTAEIYIYANTIIGNRIDALSKLDINFAYNHTYLASTFASGTTQEFIPQIYSFVPGLTFGTPTITDYTTISGYTKRFRAITNDLNANSPNYYPKWGGSDRLVALIIMRLTKDVSLPTLMSISNGYTLRNYLKLFSYREGAGVGNDLTISTGNVVQLPSSFAMIPTRITGIYWSNSTATKVVNPTGAQFKFAGISNNVSTFFAKNASLVSNTAGLKCRIVRVSNNSNLTNDISYNSSLDSTTDWTTQSRQLITQPTNNIAYKIIQPVANIGEHTFTYSSSSIAAGISAVSGAAAVNGAMLQSADGSSAYVTNYTSTIQADNLDEPISYTLTIKSADELTTLETITGITTNPYTYDLKDKSWFGYYNSGSYVGIYEVRAYINDNISSTVISSGYLKDVDGENISAVVVDFFEAQVSKVGNTSTITYSQYTPKYTTIPSGSTTAKQVFVPYEIKTSTSSPARKAFQRDRLSFINYFQSDLMAVDDYVKSIFMCPYNQAFLILDSGLTKYTIKIYNYDYDGDGYIDTLNLDLASNTTITGAITTVVPTSFCWDEWDGLAYYSFGYTISTGAAYIAKFNVASSFAAPTTQVGSTWNNSTKLIATQKIIGSAVYGVGSVRYMLILYENGLLEQFIVTTWGPPSNTAYKSINLTTLLTNAGFSGYSVCSQFKAFYPYIRVNYGDGYLAKFNFTNYSDVSTVTFASFSLSAVNKLSFPPTTDNSGYSYNYNGVDEIECYSTGTSLYESTIGHYAHKTSRIFRYDKSSIIAAYASYERDEVTFIDKVSSYIHKTDGYGTEILSLTYTGGYSIDVDTTYLKAYSTPGYDTYPNKLFVGLNIDTLTVNSWKVLNNGLVAISFDPTYLSFVSSTGYNNYVLSSYSSVSSSNFTLYFINSGLGISGSGVFPFYLLFDIIWPGTPTSAALTISFPRLQDYFNVQWATNLSVTFPNTKFYNTQTIQGKTFSYSTSNMVSNIGAVNKAGCWLSRDGTRLYVANTTFGYYQMSTPFNLSTAGSLTSIATLTLPSACNSIAFSPDLQYYICGTASTSVYLYEATTVGQISSTDTLRQTYNVSANGGIAVAVGITWTDNNYVFACNATGLVSRYLFNPSTKTIAYNSVQHDITGLTDLRGLHINLDGTKIFILDNTNKRIREHTLSTPYLPSSHTLETDLMDIATVVTNEPGTIVLGDMAFTSPFNKVYVVDIQSPIANTRIYQIDIA